MSRIDELHASWMKDPAYRKEYDALEGEFAPTAEAGTQERPPARIGTPPHISFAPPHAPGAK